MTKLLPLVFYPDKRLETVSEEVKEVNAEIKENLAELELARQKYHGSGLAGVQIGIMKKILVIDHDSFSRYEGEPERAPINKPLFMINARIIETNKEFTVLDEGCLSLPGIDVDVSRPSYVKAEYLDENGEKQIIEAEGILAKCIQHEIDHTNGIVTLNYVKSPLKRDMLAKKIAKYLRLHTDCSCPTHQH